jgi:hypothetical protein
LVKSQTEGDLGDKLEKVGQFCYEYQKMRSVEVVEEAMHGDFADVVAVPVEE